MKKYWWIIFVIVLLVVVGGTAYYFYADGSNENGGQIINGDGLIQSKVIVHDDFYENFRDGEIDDFWRWLDGNIDGNQYEIDYVREELLLSAAGNTSQWTEDDSAPVLYFYTDKNFEVATEFNFDPRSDFQHAGIGVYDPRADEWVRISRAYDTHALESDSDLADSIYLMEKVDNQLLKYEHQNFIDVKSFLKIRREDSHFVFSYSRDGEDWFDLGEIEKQDFDAEVRVYLFVYSSNINPVAASFKSIDFSVI